MIILFSYCSSYGRALFLFIFLLGNVLFINLFHENNQFALIYFLFQVNLVLLSSIMIISLEHNVLLSILKKFILATLRYLFDRSLPNVDQCCKFLRRNINIDGYSWLVFILSISWAPIYELRYIEQICLNWLNYSYAYKIVIGKLVKIFLNAKFSYVFANHNKQTSKLAHYVILCYFSGADHCDLHSLF